MPVEELTSKDRLQRLYEKKPIDRVPVTLSAGLYCAVITGTSFKDFYTDPKKAARAQTLAADLHGNEEPAQGGGGGGLFGNNWLLLELGGQVEYPDGAFSLPSVTKRTLNTVQDVDKLVFPVFGEGPISSQRLKSIEDNVARGGKVGLQISITEIVGSLIGNDKMLRWYYTKPEVLHQLYRKTTDYILSVNKYNIDKFGADKCSLIGTFPLESQNVISPETFEKFGYVYTREIAKQIFAAGVPRWTLHLCGNHKSTIKLWKNIPIASRTVISIGSEMDIKDTADFFGPEYIIAGNVSTQILQFGTPEDVYEECRTIIEKVKYHPGGFILRPACGLPPTTPPVNVQAMIRAAKILGRY